MNAEEFRTQWILDPSKEMIVEHEIMEAYHRYKSKPKTKTLEERKKNFHVKILEIEGDVYVPCLEEFFLYWTEHGENDKKMRFEKEKSFGIKRRLSTWKKNNAKWNDKKPMTLANKMKLDFNL